MRRGTLLWLATLLLTTNSVAAPAPDARLRAIAKEIRGLIADVREAMAEATPKDRNLHEICFRVGNLYQSARHELEEALEGKTNDDTLAKELIADGKSLPSFCSDKEKMKSDPGYEQVPKGNLARLETELANMDRRAKALAER
jgi:hypothetical protein